MSKKNNSNLFLTVLFISITTQSLAPRFAFSPITRYPIPWYLITLSPIARLLPTTWSLVFCCPNFSLIARSIPPTLFWSKFIPNRLLPSTYPVPRLLLFHISLPDLSLPKIYLSQTTTQSLIFCFHPWSSAFKSSSDFWKFPLYLHSPIVLYPWSILNQNGLLFLFVDWFESLTPDIFPNWSHQPGPWSSALVTGIIF